MDVLLERTESVHTQLRLQRRQCLVAQHLGQGRCKGSHLLSFERELQRAFGPSCGQLAGYVMCVRRAMT
jgi:hypothetical protein